MVRVRPYFSLEGAGRDRLGQIAEKLTAAFEAGGYDFIDLPILQPAEAYLDMAGEDVRRRIYTIETEEEGELALRADLTVPLCGRVIAEGLAGLPARLAARGACFRAQDSLSALPTEFLQYGIENLGAPDSAGADVEVFALTRQSLKEAGLTSLTVETGDVGLFDLFLEGLDLAPVWRERFSRAFRHPSRLPSLVGELSQSGPGSGLTPPSAIGAPADEDALREILARSGIEPVGRRGLDDIAARLVAKADLASAERPSAAAMKLIRQLIEIDGPADKAIAGLTGLSKVATPGFRMAMEAVADRTRAIAVALEPGDTLRFSATLGRRFNYYTGFSFHLWAEDLAAPVASGGRYDGLMQHLGAPSAVEAVGAALWPERIAATLEAGQ